MGLDHMLGGDDFSRRIAQIRQYRLCFFCRKLRGGFALRVVFGQIDQIVQIGARDQHPQIGATWVVFVFIQGDPMGIGPDAVQMRNIMGRVLRHLHFGNTAQFDLELLQVHSPIWPWLLPTWPRCSSR